MQKRLQCLMTLSLCIQTSALQAAPPAPALAPESEVFLERPAPRQGYYYTLGLYGSVVQSRENGHLLATTVGGSGAFRLGQSIMPWMDLGLAIGLGSATGDGFDTSTYSFGFDWTLHPVEPVYVRLGFALGVNRAVQKITDDKDSVFGATTTLALGYDLYPFYDAGGSGAFALSPTILLSSVQPGAGDAAYAISFGIEFTWWSGLPRNQLDLTLGEAFPAEDATP